MRIIKHFFTVVLVVISFMMGCSHHGNIYNPWNIADDDSMFLHSLDHPAHGQLYPISGSLFKAINPRFIANVYGVTGFDDYAGVRKEFELISFDNHNIPNYDNPKPITSLNVRKKWNYYINGKYTENYSRVLLSTLMLQAIQRIEYLPSDSLGTLFGGMPTGEISPEDGTSIYELISRDGSIHVYTRDISKSKINDRTTLYLINNQVVTRKIYEALNPVYIRSLKRITDPSELAEYKQKKNIKEIVDVELFTYDDLNSSSRIIECRECDVYIVDNVQIDLNIYDALRKFFFKEVRIINEDNKDAFEPYKKLFPEKNFGFDKYVTIISL